jgi:tetratricopeptide (TPR) repeat protein
MNKRGFFLAGLSCLIGAMIDWGCVPLFQNTPGDVSRGRDTERETRIQGLGPSIEKYRALAAAYEAEGRLYKAAFFWLVVHELVPDDRRARQNMDALEERIRHGATTHLARGEELTKQKSYGAARSAFFMALAYDPLCKEALERLQSDDHLPGYIRYETKPGDTIQTVARQVYQDPGKDFIVAFFSGWKSGDSITPNTVIRLPVIDPSLFQADLRESKSRQNPMTAAATRSRKASDKTLADEHYRKGVAYFIAEDVQRAIHEWEDALNFDPEHPQARRNLEKAKRLLKNDRGK